MFLEPALPACTASQAERIEHRRHTKPSIYNLQLAGAPQEYAARHRSLRGRLDARETTPLEMGSKESFFS
jgi:hypothetical protein